MRSFNMYTCYFESMHFHIDFLSWKKGVSSKFPIFPSICPSVGSHHPSVCSHFSTTPGRNSIKCPVFQFDALIEKGGLIQIPIFY